MQGMANIWKSKDITIKTKTQKNKRNYFTHVKAGYLRRGIEGKCLWTVVLEVDAASAMDIKGRKQDDLRAC